MDRRDVLALSGSVAMCALIPVMRPGFAAPVPSTGIAQTTAIAAAATAYLGSLSDEQRAGGQFPFTPQPRATAAHFRGGLRGNVDMVGEQYGRAMWSNYPVSDVPRIGLRLGTLNAAQHTAAMSLLRALLSDKGYRKVLDIMGSDQALEEAGQHYACGRAVYTLAIFGTPGVEKMWMVQFGGHHLAPNVTMLGEHGVLAPVLTGCPPAVYTENGTRVRALAAENDKAFALLGTLDDTQRRQAIIDHDVSNLVLGPGHDGEAVQPAGVKASDLNEHQQAMLYDLISEWAGVLNDIHASPRLAEIKNGLADTFSPGAAPPPMRPAATARHTFGCRGRDSSSSSRRSNRAAI